MVQLKLNTPPTMLRNTSHLADNKFEVLVIGGGIHGAAVFSELAKAGVRIALVEQNDFGSGTSANSLKLLNSGLGNLQHFDYSQMRDTIYSRKVFRGMAPHLVQPCACLTPNLTIRRRERAARSLAATFFPLFNRNRNRSLSKSEKTTGSRQLSGHQLQKVCPAIGDAAVSGGTLCDHDLVTNPERLVLSFIKDGYNSGGTAANYVRVRKLTRQKDRITGAEATDRLSGKTFAIKADLIINAAGPWVDEIRQESHQASTTECLAKGINIITNKILFGDYALRLENSGNTGTAPSLPSYSFVPWKNRTIIGTSYSYYRGKCDDLRLQAEDINTVIDEVNTLLPRLNLSPDDIVYSHIGLCPAHKPDASERDGTPRLENRSRIIDHKAVERLDGLISIVTANFTTAPAVARRVMGLLRRRHMIAGKRMRKTAPTHTSKNTPAGEELNSRYAGRFPHLASCYGNNSLAVLEIVAREGGGGNYLTHDQPLIQAEILYAVRKEMAVKLSDVVLRRTECGSAGSPDPHELQKIAEVMALELGWDDARIEQEIAQVQAHYANRLGKIP